MINFYINNYNEDIKKFIKNIKNSEFHDIVNFIFKGLNKDDYFNNSKYFNAFDLVYVNSSIMKQFNEDDFFKFSISIIDNKSIILFENYNDIIQNEKFKDVINEMDLTENIANNEFDINMSNMNLNMFYTYMEIFDKIMLEKIKTLEKIMENNIYIYQEDNSFIFKEKKFNINISIFNSLLKEINIPINNKQIFLSQFLPNTKSLINLSQKEKDEFIYNYKIKIFNKFKNLTIEDMQKLPPSIVEFLGKINYIRLSKAVEIIQKEADFNG